METETLEQGINNPEATAKIYSQLEKLAAKGEVRLQDAYGIILETIYLDILGFGKPQK